MSSQIKNEGLFKKKSKNNKGAFINTLVGGLGKMEGGPKKFWVTRRGGPKVFRSKGGVKKV